MFIRIYHLFIKELLASFRDSKARLVLIVPPLLQLLILSFTVTQEVKNISIGVYNKDVGVEGYSLVHRFEGSSFVSKVVEISHQGEIRSLLDEQIVLCVIVLPEDFSQRIYSGLESEVQILLDGRRTNACQIVLGYSSIIIEKFFSEFRHIRAARMTGQSEQAGRVGRVGRVVSLNRAGVDVIIRHWFNVNLDPVRTTAPSLICVLATVVGILIASLSIAREREMGTFEQLLVLPLTPFEILAGKTISVVFLATCSAMLMFFAVVIIFGIPFCGSFFVLVLSIDLFLCSVVGVGLFISSLSMTQQQAILGVILVLPASVMLSGFTTPVENMPLWMQYITVMNPVRWYLVIVKGVFMRGMEVSEVLLNCIPLILLSIVTLSAAAFMFKRRIE
ncbi:MAG: ABC transporter permease [Planctomycetaceae bacterium]|nr:ABC transporter permease [Planctomycetaceae bacterium]